MSPRFHVQTWWFLVQFLVQRTLPEPKQSSSWWRKRPMLVRKGRYCSLKPCCPMLPHPWKIVLSMIPMVFFLDGLQPSSSHDFLHWGCHNPVVGQFCSSDAMMMLNPLKSNIFRHPNIRVPDISYIYIYIYISVYVYTIIHLLNYLKLYKRIPIILSSARWSPQGRSICFSPAMSPTTKAGDFSSVWWKKMGFDGMFDGIINWIYIVIFTTFNN